MKREIKFRAWNEGKMIDLLAITPLALDANMNTQLALKNMGGLFLPFGGNIELMQYTGLKDKNGKEIYEGDIIITETGKTMVIDWDKKYASFVIEYDGWAFKHYFGEAFEAVYCEVVGNIYENPELL